jgi:hypothetical protein
VSNYRFAPNLPILDTEVTMEDRQAPAQTARATLFAALAVTLVVALRARSDGPGPGLLMIVAAVVLVALVARRVTGRERSLPIVFAGLLGTQLVLHAAFLFISTGAIAHAGSVGFFCSPASPGGAASTCSPTDRGGVTLLSVQLLAAVLAAIWLRGLDSTVWALARTVARNLTSAVLGRLPRLLSAFTAVAAVGVRILRETLVIVERPHSMRLCRHHARRGPPLQSFCDAIRSSFSASALPVTS